MNPIEKIVAEYGVMILDGAFSTELERRGCDLNDPLWSAKMLVIFSGAALLVFGVTLIVRAIQFGKLVR